MATMPPDQECPKCGRVMYLIDARGQGFLWECPFDGDRVVVPDEDEE